MVKEDPNINPFTTYSFRQGYFKSVWNRYSHYYFEELGRVEPNILTFPEFYEKYKNIDFKPSPTYEKYKKLLF
jgi:hypothetical protein